MIEPTKLTLDQVRFLRIKSADVILLEDSLGKGWIQALTERTEKQLVYFLWAGLRWREERLTPTQVSEYLDVARENGVTIADLWDGVGRMLANAGFLPKAVQNGHPTMTDEPTPAPSPGEPTASGRGSKRSSEASTPST